MIDASRLAFPKGSTKLDRAVRNKAARLSDRQQLDAWAFAVKARDRWQDRKTGVRTLRTRALDPLRAEAHHIVPKSDRAVRYDVRNGLCVSLATHEAVELNRLKIIGTVFFVKNGRRYIDATYPVRFVPT